MGLEESASYSHWNTAKDELLFDTKFRDFRSIPNAGGHLTCRETQLLRVF